MCLIQKFSLFIFLINLELCSGQNDDYWKKSFDSNQDCAGGEEIQRLSAMKPSQCETTKIENTFGKNILEGTQKAFSDCKILLTIRLQKICDFYREEAIWF